MWILLKNHKKNSSGLKIVNGILLENIVVLGVGLQTDNYFWFIKWRFHMYTEKGKINLLQNLILICWI